MTEEHARRKDWEVCWLKLLLNSGAYGRSHMKYIECENIGTLGFPRGGENMNGNLCSVRHIRCIAWNARRGGCAYAAEKQKLNDRGNVQQMANEMHSKWKDGDANMPQEIGRAEWLKSKQWMHGMNGMCDNEVQSCPWNSMKMKGGRRSRRHAGCIERMYRCPRQHRQAEWKKKGMQQCNSHRIVCKEDISGTLRG